MTPWKNQEAYPSCRFYLEIEGRPEAVFTEVSGLQAEMDVTEIEEGGNNGFVHRLPGRTKIGNLTMKRGVTRTNEFFNWFMEVAEGKITRRNVSLLMFDVGGNELARWNFEKAYPVKWVGPQLSADGSANSVETLELAHAGMRLAR